MKFFSIFLVGACAFVLFGCGGKEPDAESCVTAGGKTTCCRTYCNDSGTKCNTTCN